MEAFGKLKVFFSQRKRLRYKKHEIILRANEDPSGVFYLDKGYVRLYTVSVSGQELTLIVFKPQDLFPLMWTFNDRQNNYYLEAVTSVDLLRVERTEFLDFVEKNPDVSHEILKKMLTRLGGLLVRMEYLTFGNAYQKIASILLIFAERFGEKNGKIITIDVPLTHKDVASFVGITRETTSVEIKKLKDKKIIDYKGPFIKVLSMERLKRESLLNYS